MGKGAKKVKPTKMKRTQQQIDMEQKIAQEQHEKALRQTKLVLKQKERELSMRIEPQLKMWEEMKKKGLEKLGWDKETPKLVTDGNCFLEKNIFYGQTGTATVIGDYIPEWKLLNLKEQVEFDIEEMKKNIKEYEDIDKEEKEKK